MHLAPIRCFPSHRRGWKVACWGDLGEGYSLGKELSSRTSGPAGLFLLEAGDQHCLKAGLLLTASPNFNSSQEGDIETHLTASIDPTNYGMHLCDTFQGQPAAAVPWWSQWSW